MVGDIRAQAEAAVDLMLVDREAAVSESEKLLASGVQDPAAASMANRVLASVFTHRGKLTEALEHADRSVAGASESGEDALIGLALLTRMGALISSGRPRDAIEDSIRAQDLLPPDLRVRLLIQRGTALGLGLGQVDEAINTYDQVERDYPNMEAIVEAVLTMNRGTQLIAKGDHHRALADFSRARARYRELGNVEAECDVLLHQARAAANIGDFPTVFALHADVEQRNLLARFDHRTHNDLASALLNAGLRSEAEAVSRRALETAGSELTTPASCEAALRVALIRGEFGDHDAAFGLCENVEQWARARNLVDLELSSSLVRRQIEMHTSAPSEQTLSRLEELVADLEAAGRSNEGLDIRIEAAAMALSLGNPGRVAALLAPFGAGPQRHGDEPSIARSRHAAALDCLAAGEPGLALRHLSLGLDALERMRSVIGAMEIRAAAVDRAPALARLGLGLATQRSKPRQIMLWAERQRATAMRLTAHSHLRRVDGVDDSGRATRQSGVGLSRRSPGEVLAALGDRTLIEFIEIDGALHTLVARQGRVSHNAEIGNVSEVLGHLNRLQFGLRRLHRFDERTAGFTIPMIQAAATELENLLLPAVDFERSELVLVPTGALHDVPWRAMPRLESQPFSVVPSADSWLRAESMPKDYRSLAAVIGPRLNFAGEEVVRVGGIYGAAANKEPASVDVALGEFESCDVLHVAAHGNLRDDNAVFSSLEMADGPLFVHQLENLHRLPSLIVLSSCSVGALGRLVGDEVLGFPAALLARGTRSLIASILPVEDEAAMDLMVALHSHLKTGLGPACALASAADEVRDKSPRHWAAAASFLCFGAG